MGSERPEQRTKGDSEGPFSSPPSPPHPPSFLSCHSFTPALRSLVTSALRSLVPLVSLGGWKEMRVNVENRIDDQTTSGMSDERATEGPFTSVSAHPRLPLLTTFPPVTKDD